MPGVPPPPSPGSASTTPGSSASSTASEQPAPKAKSVAGLQVVKEEEVPVQWILALHAEPTGGRPKQDTDMSIMLDSGWTLARRHMPARC
eukprot:6967967-Alexandrium_andersonii.AAC.1